MTQPATVVPLHSMPSAVELAVVTGPCDSKGCVPVGRRGDAAGRPARVAIHPLPNLSPGDEVLTLSDGNGGNYIVGILSCKSDVKASVERIRLADGSEVRIDRSPENESLKLFSGKNELLIDYRTRNGTMTVNAASGNLEFAAPEGGIAFRCARDIHLDGNHVAVNARSDLHVGVQAANGRPGPAMRMRSGRMQLSAPIFDLTAQRAKLFLQETHIAGRKLLGRIGDVQFIARKIESAADTVMAKAKNVYRTISELSQLKAGRQRTLIDKTCHMKAQKTILKSETDFKVKAEKIHLG